MNEPPAPASAPRSPAATASAQRRRQHARAVEGRAGLLFATPWMLWLALFMIVPLIATFAIGFTSYNVSSTPKYVGLANYEQMVADPAFWKSVRNTLVFTALMVPIKLALALFLALMLNRQTRLSGLYRTIFYLPFFVPLITSSVIFMLLLAPGAGPVNEILKWLGFAPPDWVKNPRVAIWTLILISLWQLGVETLVFLSGLKNIPSDVHEAALLDSDKKWHRLVWITLPLLTPVILFNLVISVISSFQVFVQAITIGTTTGQPAESTLVYLVLIYRTAFRYFNMGYAAALSTVLFFAVLLVTIFIFRTARSWVYYEGESE